MGGEWGNITIESVSATISDAMFGLDQSGNLIFWNEAAGTLFGYTETQASGESLEDLFDLTIRDQAQIESLLEKTDSDGQGDAPSDSVTITATTQSEASVPVEVTVVGTDVEGVLCVGHPINEVTNGRTYPEAIDDSVFRRAIEGSSDLIAAADQHERLLFANKRYREFHDIDEPVPGQSLSNVLPLETYTELKPYFDQVLEGETVQFEMDRLGADGNKHTFDVRYYPLGSATGTIHGAVTTMREITELKQRATSLRKSWETYRDLLDGVPHPLLVHQTDGEIVEVNQAVCRIVGIAEEDLLEKNVKELLISNHAEQYGNRAETITEDKQFFETVLQTTGGTKIPVAVATTRIEYFGSEAILSIARDLSEFKAYERELEETNARLEEFAAVVSEDLRNPLTVARGWANIAQEKTGLESLDRVVESLDQMDDVINYTLTLAKKGEGLGDLSKIELSEVVTHCWHNVNPIGATLTNDVELTIRADLGRLGHLVETLFEDCAAISTEQVTITVGNLEYRDGFYISHDGPEIPSVNGDDAVQSAHIGSKERPDCNLKVVQRIAQAHGWRFQFDSPEDAGVKFEFSNVDVVTPE